MKFFFDTEFVQGRQPKKFLGWEYAKTKALVDLVSIGIVNEKGEKFFRLSNDFNLDYAWNMYDWVGDEHGTRDYWIRMNVLLPIFNKYVKGTVVEFDQKGMRWVLDNFGTSNEQIAKDILEFVVLGELPGILRPFKSGSYYKMLSDVDLPSKAYFYAYYGAYDWVAFCQLYGTPMDLPKGFYASCRDLKQQLDEVVDELNIMYLRDIKEIKNDTDRLATFEEKLAFVKSLKYYPTQENEHMADDYAFWNFELYQMITSGYLNNEYNIMGGE